MSDLSSLWQPKSRVLSNQALEDWPLHIKNVQSIQTRARFDQCSSLFPQSPFLRPMQNALSMLVTANLASSVSIQESSLLPADISALVAAGLIVKTSPRPGDWPCRSFSVEEPAKRRRRWIVHPGSFNKELPCSEQSADQFLLPKPADIMRRVAKWSFARCIDLTAYYHQFGLDDGPRFIFRQGSEYFATKTIPTGGSCCPKLAQNFSLMLAEEATRRLHLIHGTSTILGVIDVYIDNFRVLSNSVVIANELLLILFKVCEELNVAVNETPSECLAQDPQQYEFLGIKFDHVCCTTELGTKTITKLRSLLASKKWMSPVATMQEMLSIYGLLTFASTTANVPRAGFYHAIKFMRRRASSRFHLHSVAQVWPSTFVSWEAWTTLSLEADPRIWRKDSEDDVVVSLFTDASNSGMGSVILQDDQPMKSFGSRWNPFLRRKHINILEAHAVLRGLIILQARLSGISQANLLIDVFIDNTSVLFTTMKGSSKSFELNAIVGQIWLLPITRCVRSWQYVKSADNLADGPSRWFQNPRNFI